MIHVPRNQVDENAQKIKPNDDWFKLAREATKEAIKEKKDHDANRDVYAHDEVNKSLNKLFKGKCAYCETDLVRFDWEVEHFRPKGSVHESPKHPGYYWLAYKWENLYPSCTWCNQRRKGAPVWGTDDVDPTEGKGTQFPLSDEKSRAKNPQKAISKEKTLLLDPCKDNPERLFLYDPLGQIYPKSKNKKAEITAKVFNLKETHLKNARRMRIDEIVKTLRILKGSKMNGDQELIDMVNQLFDSLMDESREYLGAVRYVVNNPENFEI